MNEPRFPAVAPAAMSPRQKEVADKIAGGPRGGVRGPFLALIHHPDHRAFFPLEEKLLKRYYAESGVTTKPATLAEYLDKAYPEKPVMPSGTNVLMAAFEPTYCSVAYANAVKYILKRTLTVQNESSREYFISTRLAMLGASSWDAIEQNAEQQWEDWKKGLAEVDKWYQKSGGKWIMGDTFSFADMMVACRTMWWNTILDEEQRQEFHSLNGGRWAQVLADVNAECGTDL